MHRFTLSVLLLFVVLVGLLLVFGTGRRSEDQLVIWTQDYSPGRALLDSLLKVYMQENPGVKVEMRYYETEELRSNFLVAALGGSGPDLVYGPADAVGPFHVMGVLHPLQDFFSEEELALFDEKGKVYYKGNLYMLADRIGNHLTLVYNKKMLSTPPQTTDELFELGKRFSRDLDGDGLMDSYALVWNFIEPFFFIPFLGGYGGWVMDENARPTLNNQATIDACNFILRLRQERVIPRECNLDIANELFKTQKAALIINGPWSWGGYIDAGVDIGLARIPKVSETGLWATPMVSATGYSINANTTGERLERTLQLLRYLTSPEVELEFTRRLKAIPSRVEARQHPLIESDPILIGSLDQITVGKPMPVDPEMRAIWDAMRPAYQSVLNGTMTPEQAARKMQADAEKLITEMLK